MLIIEGKTAKITRDDTTIACIPIPGDVIDVYVISSNDNIYPMRMSCTVGSVELRLDESGHVVMDIWTSECGILSETSKITFQIIIKEEN